MRQSLKLGRVGGIPVGVHWTVAVIVLLVADILAASVLPAAAPGRPALLYWTVAVAGALVFALSLLAHELSHAVVAKRHGVGVRSITLWMLGGVAELENDPPDPGADLRIALAGPAASLGAAIALAGLGLAAGWAGGPPIIVAALTWLALMNAVLAVFNLLPGAPMDGGRVLRALLWRHYHDRVRAAVAAAKAGRFIGFALIAAGVAELIGWASIGGLWLMLIGWFLESAARAEAAATVAEAALAGLRVADVMTPDPPIAPGWRTAADFAEQVAAHARTTAFPVVSFDGRLAGIVTSDQLASLPPQQRSALRLEQVALPVPASYLAAPGDPAESLAIRRPIGGEVVAVVLGTEGQVVGLVTTLDLRWGMRQARLRTWPGAGDVRDGSDQRRSQPA